jgi:hypothetical protein
MTQAEKYIIYNKIMQVLLNIKNRNHNVHKFCLFQGIEVVISILFIFSIVMTPMFSTVLAQQQNNSLTEHKYENTKFGIEMQYPADWTKVGDNTTTKGICNGGLCLNFTFLKVNFNSPPPASGAFGISVMTSSKPMSYTDWLSNTLPLLKKKIESMGGKIVESKVGNIAGIQGYKMTFNQNGLIHTDWTIVANEKIYNISYTIFQNETNVLPTFQRVINSIAIPKITNNQTSTIKNEFG